MISKHITRLHNSITEIRCKNCGTIIAGMVPHDHPDFSRVRRLEDGSVLRQTHLIFRHNSMYQELTLLMDDGTKHVTHLCTACVPKLQTNLDALTEAMQIDMDELKHEGLHHSHVSRWKSRKVVGVTNV